MEKYKKIEWVPKETYDSKKDVLYIDHKKLVRKETIVKVSSPKELREAFSKGLKNYDMYAILKFKPNKTEVVHLHYSPFSE